MLPQCSVIQRLGDAVAIRDSRDLVHWLFSRKIHSDSLDVDAPLLSLNNYTILGWISEGISRPASIRQAGHFLSETEMRCDSIDLLEEKGHLMVPWGTSFLRQS